MVVPVLVMMVSALGIIRYLMLIRSRSKLSLVQFAMVTFGGVVVKFCLFHVFVLLKRLQYGLVPDINVDHPMPFYVPVSCLACGVGILLQRKPARSG
jgi:hypothetical protein